MGRLRVHTGGGGYVVCLGRGHGWQPTDGLSARIYGCLTMSVAFVAPGRSMRIGLGQIALWRPLRTAPSAAGDGSFNGPWPNAIAGLSGWWDAGGLADAIGAAGMPVGGWNSATASLRDKSGNSVALAPYSFGPATGPPAMTPRLSALLGGLGRAAGGPGSLTPALDPDLGFQVANASFQSSVAWTRYLVWSRPNWRQNSGRDANPITLIASGNTPVLSADSASGQGRLLLFPGSYFVYGCPSPSAITS
jgi:hypothetical protein